MRIYGTKNKRRAKLIIKRLRKVNLYRKDIQKLLKINDRFFELNILYPLVKYNIIRKKLGKKICKFGRRPFIYMLGNYDINTLHKLGL